MKGRIIEINNGYAIVITKNGEFVKTRNYKKASVGDEITVCTGFAGYTKAIAAAAAMVAVFCGTAVSYCMPTSYVDICINPEIELKLNMYDIVIGAEGKNDDGAAVLGRENVKNVKLKNALDDIIENAQSLGFIPENEEKTVVLSVFAKNEGTAKSLYESVKAYEVPERINKVVKIASSDDVTNANAENLSVGKYLLVNEVADAVPEMSKEEWKNHSVKEIITTLDKVKDNSVTTTSAQAENPQNTVGGTENVIENKPKISPKPETGTAERPTTFTERKTEDIPKPQTIKADERNTQKPTETRFGVPVGDIAPKEEKKPVIFADSEPMPNHDGGNAEPNDEPKPPEIESRDNEPPSNNSEFEKPPITSGDDFGENNIFDDGRKDDNNNVLDNEPVNGDGDMTLQNGDKTHSGGGAKADSNKSNIDNRPNENPNGGFGDRQDEPSNKDFDSRPNENPNGGFGDRKDEPSDKDFGNRPNENPNGGFGDRQDEPSDKDFGNRPNDNPNGGFGDRQDTPPDRDFGNRPNENPNGGFDNRQDEPSDKDFGNRPNENPNGGFDNRQDEPSDKDFNSQLNENPNGGFGDRQDEPSDKDFDNRPNENPNGGFGDRQDEPSDKDFDNRPNENPNGGFDDRQDTPPDRDFDDRTYFDMPSFDGGHDEMPSEWDFGDSGFDGEWNDAPDDNPPPEHENGFNDGPFGE